MKKRIAALLLMAVMVVGLLPVMEVKAADVIFTANCRGVEGDVEGDVEVTFKVLTEPEGETLGTVQVGNGELYEDGRAVVDSITSVTIPETVAYDGKFYTVTGIGDYAFCECKSLSSISVPLATSIGVAAFYDCLKLKSIEIPLATSIGDAAFAFCNSLTDINIPLVTSIGDNAFAKCWDITNISTPLATSIGDAAFVECSKLSSINIPLVTSIGMNAFAFCHNLSEISIPLVTSIAEATFSGCKVLSSINIPLVTSIGNDAFSNCQALTVIDIPLATSIGIYAFSGCEKLISIDISSVTSIDDLAFDGCSSIKSITCGSIAPTLGSKVFAPNKLNNITLYIPYSQADSSGYNEYPWSEMIHKIRYGISGTVKDSSSNPIAGASVTLNNINVVTDVISVVTDTNGEYIIPPSLDSGEYTVTVEKTIDGYVEATTNVTIDSASKSDINFQLKRKLFVTYDANGGGTETMEVGTAVEGEPFELPQCDFTAPSGQYFKAWAIGSTTGEQVDAGSTYAFTEDTTVYAIWEDPAAPTIAGDTSIILTEGYAATETAAYTITGVPTSIIVKKTSGDERITWDDTEKKLKIPAGLTAGSYPVVLTATNGVYPDAEFTFTLTVNRYEAPIYGYTPIISPPTAGEVKFEVRTGRGLPKIVPLDEEKFLESILTQEEKAQVAAGSDATVYFSSGTAGQNTAIRLWVQVEGANSRRVTALSDSFGFELQLTEDFDNILITGSNKESAVEAAGRLDDENTLLIFETDSFPVYLTHLDDAVEPDEPEYEPEESKEDETTEDDEAEPEPTEEPKEEVDLEDVETPEGDGEEALPSTGTTPVGIFYGIGAACIIIGGVIAFNAIKLKRKEDEV